MARTGIVLSIENDRALVSTTLRGACGECSDEGCAMHIGGQPVRSELVVATLGAGAHVGDRVEIELPGHTELGVSMLVWVVPMVGLIGGAALGVVAHDILGISEDVGALGGMTLGFLGAFAGLKAVDRRLRGHHRLMPQITKVLPPPSCGPAETSLLHTVNDPEHSASPSLPSLGPSSTPRR